MATPSEFDRCLKRPALFRSGAFALHFLGLDAPAATLAGDGEEPSWRLGLVIPKRYEASAVARNTIKRRWRDAFRRGRSSWAAEFGSADLVVRMQAPLVPKPPKRPVARRAAGADAPTLAAKTAVPIDATGTTVGAARPARVRARDRFDPETMLIGLVDRLRRRGATA